MRKEALTATVLFVILAISEIPAYAFVIGPNPSYDNGAYQLYGPHVKGLNIIVYSDATAEWTAMAAGQIDLEDWALTAPYISLWSNNANGMVEANYGGEAGYYLLDINNNPTYTPNDATPGVHNPTSALPLRQALACAANRQDIMTFTGGLALPIWTPVPKYMASYINTNIDPNSPSPLHSWAYDSSAMTGDIDRAINYLTANGYTIDGSGWRIDPVSQGGDGLPMNLIFYSRGGDRGTFGDHYNTILNDVLKIKTTYFSNVPRSTVTGPVFAQEYFNLYTGGWTGIGPDPDYLCDLYNSSNYYHPGSPPNYDGINYPLLNGDLTAIKAASSIAAGTTAALAAQVDFATEAAAIPLWCYTGVKDYKNLAVANGQQWIDLMNPQGVGVNSWWSTLTMRQATNQYPNAFANYGFSSTVQMQNIVYSQWYWDQEVLGRIYDSGARRNPYNPAKWVRQLYKYWPVGTWYDTKTNAYETMVTITINPNVRWQDGYPFSVADVIYTLFQISKDLHYRGFPPPWWYPAVQYIVGYTQLSLYSLRLFLRVNSPVWAVGWVIGNVVIPKHIWKPIVDASTVGSVNPRNVDATTPDPYIIGTGPFRWYSGVGSATGQTIVLVANKPGSSAPDPATGLPPKISPGYYFYYPGWVDPGAGQIYISPTAANVTVPINITVGNMDTDDNFTVSEYIYVNDVLQPGYPVNDVTLQPTADPEDPLGNADNITLTLTLDKKTLTFVDVDVQLTGPSTLADGEANPWIGAWVNQTLPFWVTITVDITGTTLYDALGYTSYPTWLKDSVPAPDLKVDGKDIATAALAYGTVPGDLNWSPVADVNGDYKIDGKDIALIALNYGY